MQEEENKIMSSSNRPADAPPSTIHHKDFLISFPFKNNLPSGPYGPYFRNIETLTCLKDFPEYRTSTVEKNYIWQPHFGPEVGIKLDLFDAESMLVTDQSQQQKLDALDKKVIHNIKSDVKGNKTKFLDQENKPWWLRNTYYLENNPFNTASKYKDEDLVEKSKDVKEKFTDPKRDVFSKEFADHSFKAAKETIQKLKEKTPKRKIAWSCPILPIQFPSVDEFEETKKAHSLVRFDEDPVLHLLPLDSTGVKHALVSEEELAVKRRRVQESIVLNARESLHRDDSGKHSHTYDVTVVIPKETTTSTGAKKGKSELYDLLGDSDEEEEGNKMEIEGEENKDTTEKEKGYEWLKDYRMEIKDRNLEDSFMILIEAPKGSNGTAQKAASAVYFSVHSRIDMKKLHLDVSEPHDCVVSRRE